MKATMPYAIGCGLAVCLLLCAADTAAVTGPCSNASLKGGYAFLYRTAGPSFVSATIQVGRLDADGNGKFTEVFTLSQAGVTTHQTGSGTYVVNPDCSGGFLDNAIQGNGFQGTRFIVLDAGDRVATVSQIPNLFNPSLIGTGQMQRISVQNNTSPCSNDSLKGVFLSVEEGLRPTFVFNFPVDAGIGKLVAFVADGVGNVAGGAIEAGATVVPTFSEIYTVNPDCTGSFDRVYVGSTEHSHADFVISGDGRTVYGVITDVNVAVHIIAGRQ